MSNIFSWLKVLDCTRVFSWPFASRYFADYWAEVIKIETKNNFDEARYFTPIKNDFSWYFEILNRWKKSLNLNLKNKRDLNIFYKLIKESDIFLENFSPNIKNKLKISYKSLKKINKKIIYWSLNWYWEYNNKKAYDTIIQAECGLASLNWEIKPMKNATSIIDTFSWNTLALWVTSLLYKREQTWIWWFVNIPMIACWLQLTEANITEYSITKTNPSFVWNWDISIFPFWFFKAWKLWNENISIAIWNNELWKKFVLEFMPEISWKYLNNQERLKNKVFLTNKIESSFSEFEINDLINLLNKIWIPNSKINKMSDIFQNKELYKNNFLKKVKHKYLWDIVVPYEYIKYWDYNIEEYKFSPYFKI